MNHRSNLIVASIIGVLAIILVAGVAHASQTAIFGGPGTAPQLNPNCSRATMFVTPAGKTWAGAGASGKKYVFAISTVLGGQIKCLIHRVDTTVKPDTCFAQAGAVPVTSEAAADRQGYHDTRGLNALAAWAKRLQLCEAAR